MKSFLLSLALACSLFTSAQTSKIQNYLEESVSQDINSVKHFVIDNGKFINTQQFIYFDKLISQFTNSSFSNMGFDIYELTGESIKRLNRLEATYSEVGLVEIYNIARQASVKEEIMNEDATLIFQGTTDDVERRMTITCENTTHTTFQKAVISLYYGDDYKVIIFPTGDIDPDMITSLESWFLTL